MRSAEEWGAFCLQEHQGFGNAQRMCLDCARAYARECVEAWREKAAIEAEQRMYDRIQPRMGAGYEEAVRWQERVLTAKEIAAALRALPGKTL